MTPRPSTTSTRSSTRTCSSRTRTSRTSGATQDDDYWSVFRRNNILSSFSHVCYFFINLKPINKHSVLSLHCFNSMWFRYFELEISPTRVPSCAGNMRSTSLMSPKLVCWVGDSITRHSRTSRTPSQLTSTPMIIGRLASGLCPMYAHHHKPDEDPPPLDRHHGEEEEDEMKQKSQNLISVREAFQNFKRKTKIQIVTK